MSRPLAKRRSSYQIEAAQSFPRSRLPRYYKLDKGEDNATVWHLEAPIDAATGATAAFSAPRELFSAPGSYDKNRVLERLDGSWLLPLYDSRVNSPFNAFLPRGADAGVPVAVS